MPEGGAQVSNFKLCPDSLMHAHKVIIFRAKDKCSSDLEFGNRR